jgi:hypothetical protein
MQHLKRKCDDLNESGGARELAPMLMHSNVLALEPSYVKWEKPRVPAQNPALKFTHINDLEKLRSFPNKLLFENAQLQSQLAVAVADIVEKYSVIVRLCGHCCENHGPGLN